MMMTMMGSDIRTGTILEEPRHEGVLDTDAQLYTIIEEEQHTILKMPSRVPASLAGEDYNTTTFNLVMLDTSHSMDEYWVDLKESWNEHVCPVLKGRTSIFTFSNRVQFIRSGTKILPGDMNGGMTNLTGALEKMADEIYSCEENYVNVFLVTDGGHNATEVEPDGILARLKAPETKVVNMFVLGAGNGFPVRYSIALRSHLHNGNSNMPSLFWAKNSRNIKNELKKIADCITSGVSQSLSLSQSGFSLPGTLPKNTFHLNEFVYFPVDAERVRNLTLSIATRSGSVSLETRPIRVSELMDVFRQWNTILIQLHMNKEPLPSDPLGFMKKLFDAAASESNRIEASSSIRDRLKRKDKIRGETEFNTLMNEVRAVLTSNKFANGVEFAETILKTTVSGGKYEDKGLRMKGHTDQDFKDDFSAFLETVKKQRDAIVALEKPPEDCCRVTMGSTVLDLEDPDLEELKNLNKFQFLSLFTISGIGVYAPVRDSALMNPWSFRIKYILGPPFSIVSQVAMEKFAETRSGVLNGRDKQVQLQQADEKTRFNAVVPVFPPGAAKVMEPIVKTRVYAMCTTFTILKNPHVIDFNIHFAALGVTWVRLLHEFPSTPRPEHVERRIQSIVETADLYLQRAGYQKFWTALKTNPAQALMTESTAAGIKCESLVKPMFIMHLQQRHENLEPSTLIPIIEHMLLEYIGRCVTQHRQDPYTDFFAEELTNEITKHELSARLAEEVVQNETGYRLKDFFTLEEAMKAAKLEAARRLKDIRERFTQGVTIALNTTKVMSLRNVSSAGDVSLPTLRTFVNEVGIPPQIVKRLFSDENLTIYTAHALEYRNSRERLANPMPTHKEAIEKVTLCIQKEHSAASIGREVIMRLVEFLTKGWLEEYEATHRSVVKPMTQQQIVTEANRLGVSIVSEETFDQVYRNYRPLVGLLRNACQSRECPHFLRPDRRYNQHASVARQNPNFVHNMHNTIHKHRNDEDLSDVIYNLSFGTYKRSHSSTISMDIIEPLIDDLASLKLIYQQGLHTSS